MSECEIPEYYVVKEPIAKKKHECRECNAPILPEEKYTQVNACWEKSPGVYRQHDICAKACELVRDAGFNDDECLAFGQLKEWWYETRHESFRYDKNVVHWRKELWFLMLKIFRRERKVTP